MIQHTHNWSAQKPKKQNNRKELKSHQSVTPHRKNFPEKAVWTWKGLSSTQKNCTETVNSEKIW